MNTQVFQYNDNPVTFRLGNGDVMIDATQMAAPFGKRPAKWLELPSTIEFLTELRNVRKSDNLIRSFRGKNGGTWFHEDVALEFARWLSPAFAIWANDRIKDLLRTGAASMPGRLLPGPSVSDKIRAAKFIASFLQLNDSSKLLLAKSIAEPLGLPTPDYTPSKGIIRSCAELLKTHNVGISPQQFNQKMIVRGFMVELTRPSLNGKAKRFKSITGGGLEYGENQVNPNNPKSTQPLYYANKFTALLNVLGYEN